MELPFPELSSSQLIAFSSSMGAMVVVTVETPPRLVLGLILVIISQCPLGCAGIAMDDELGGTVEDVKPIVKDVGAGKTGGSGGGGN